MRAWRAEAATRTRARVHCTGVARTGASCAQLHRAHRRSVRAVGASGVRTRRQCSYPLANTSAVHPLGARPPPAAPDAAPHATLPKRCRAHTPTHVAASERTLHARARCQSLEAAAEAAAHVGAARKRSLLSHLIPPRLDSTQQHTASHVAASRGSSPHTLAPGCNAAARHPPRGAASVGRRYSATRLPCWWRCICIVWTFGAQHT